MRTPDQKDRERFAALVAAGFSEHEAAAIIDRPLEWFTGDAQ